MIRVTITDTENGDTETAEIWNDYLLIAAGNRYLAHVQEHASGTTVLTIKTNKDGEA